MSKKYQEYSIEEVVSRADGTTWLYCSASGKPESIERELYQYFANETNNDRYDHVFEVYAYTPCWQKIKVGAFTHTLNAKNEAYLKKESAKIVGCIK